MTFFPPLRNLAVLALLAAAVPAAFTPARADGPPKPDLIITSVGVDGGQATEGQGVTFTATIKNQGTAPTPPDTVVSVTFLDATGLPPDSKAPGKMLTYSSGFRGPLAPGQSQDVKADRTWKTPSGTFTIRAVVDDVRRIDESDRSNNEFTQDITVAPDPVIDQAMSGGAEPSTYKPSTNELIPNGDFETPNAPLPISQGQPQVVSVDGTHALMFTDRLVYQWDAPDKIIQGADYTFSCRVKSVNVSGGANENAGDGLFLWACQPVLHEPPPGGAQPVANWNGSFNWKHFDTPFTMPLGVSRFVIFFNSNVPNGWSDIDDLSLRPVDDEPLDIPADAPLYGSNAQEQMLWIWNDPAFPWQGIPSGDGANMTSDQTKPVPKQEVWFRRTLDVPEGVRAAQATFVGDDSAVLLVNGREAGQNTSWQDIERVPLQDVLKPGRNEFLWKVTNNFGPGGLLGRVEWESASGGREIFPTNARWECSSDLGKTWKPAAPVAVPAPASTQFDWCYPHLPKLSYDLTYSLPADTSNVRLAVRSPGSFRVLADGKEVYVAVCASHSIKVDLSGKAGPGQKLTVMLEDISQPPAGAGILQIKEGGVWKRVPFSAFRHEGQPPQAVTAFFSTRTWPTNIGSFDAAASRPVPDRTSHLEPWAKAILSGSQPIFQLGQASGTSDAFGPIDQHAGEINLPVGNLKTCPGGLAAGVQPELALHFKLDRIPPNGAAFVLGVEDSGAVVSSVGVFVNGILCGMPQVLGYDSAPGGRLTNRAWLVTVPPERLLDGANTVTLRLLPSYYRSGGDQQNQSQDYIKMMGLGDAAQCPYKSSWLTWNYLGLYALASPIADPVNGRPVWLGTNLGNLPTAGLSAWRDYILRDLAYLGLTGTGAPIRFGIFDAGQFAPLKATDPALPNGQSVGDYELSALTGAGIHPHLLCEPGRNIQTADQLVDSNEASVLQEFGKYFSSMEVGNEVDNPCYGWDSLRFSDGFATIQRQAACAQMLKAAANLDLTVVGEGWYHAWDFSLIDAQERKEAANDPAFTDGLSTHDYAKSYIIPAVGYYLLYGSNAPKPIWTTECGAWSAQRDDAADFDENLRGNLAFATYILQYLTHPYNDEMTHFALFSASNKDAHIMERARDYRRLLHAYAVHGAPLPWQYADPAAMRDKLVFVNPVDAGKWLKLSFVNFSREKQPVDVTIRFPPTVHGPLPATRYGDGIDVAGATTQKNLEIRPLTRFQETLGPGETVEYLVAKPE